MFKELKKCIQMVYYQGLLFKSEEFEQDCWWREGGRRQEAQECSVFKRPCLLLGLLFKGQGELFASRGMGRFLVLIDSLGLYKLL